MFINLMHGFFKEATLNDGAIGAYETSISGAASGAYGREGASYLFNGLSNEMDFFVVFCKISVSVDGEV